MKTHHFKTSTNSQAIATTLTLRISPFSPLEQFQCNKLSF